MIDEIKFFRSVKLRVGGSLYDWTEVWDFSFKDYGYGVGFSEK